MSARAKRSKKPRRSTVLLTCFEPFGGQAINASASAIEAVEARRIRGAKLVKAELPCVFGEAIAALKRELRIHRPELVICVGQAGGRDGFTIERIAINVDDARIPDNEGAQPIDEAIAMRGPAAYWSTLPIKAIAKGLNDKGIPASVSQTAGTFVCNHVFYGLMHTLKRRKGVRGGFVHIPYLPEQAKKAGKSVPSLPLDTLARGLEHTVRIALRTKRDVRLAAGATH